MQPTLIFQLKQFEDVLRRAKAASGLKAQTIAQLLLTSRALEGLGRDAEAYTVLTQASKDFKSAFRPWLELAALAHRKGLQNEVRRAAEQVMGRNPDRDAQIVLFHLLYGDPKGLTLLEQIVAQSPEDPQLRGLLAHAFAGDRAVVDRGTTFEEATALGGAYAFEAADQYRMAGRYRNALRMNDAVSKSVTQIEQRVSILFERQEYARIVAMKANLRVLVLSIESPTLIMLSVMTQLPKAFTGAAKHQLSR